MFQNFNNLTGVAPSDIARIGGMVEYADYCPYWMVGEIREWILNWSIATMCNDGYTANVINGCQLAK